MKNNEKNDAYLKNRNTRTTEEQILYKATRNRGNAVIKTLKETY